MRVAVLADAHGNLLALEAVLADVHAQAPDLVVNLGDLATGPFDPAGSADVQIALGCPTLAGNHERNLLEGDDISGSVAFARPRLSAAHMAWIGRLLQRYGLRTARCLPATAAPPAATSITYSMTYRVDGPFSPLMMRSGRGWLALAPRALSYAATRTCPEWSRSAT